jgi:hypothetical protein
VVAAQAAAGVVLVVLIMVVQTTQAVLLEGENPVNAVLLEVLARWLAIAVYL